VEKLYNSSSLLIERHIKDLEVFREQVSKKLSIMLKEVAELHEMFASFEADQKNKMKGFEIFENSK
jgi:hypothetical protein